MKFLISTFLSLCCWASLSAQWTTQNLSENKFYTQAAAAAGKALFIGGAKIPGFSFAPSKKIEIYDFATRQWLPEQPTQNGTVLSGVAVADSLVFIAGGQNPQTGVFYKLVEVFDAKNNKWKPTQNLSIARSDIATVKVGQEIWFAGGAIQTSATNFTYYDVIDIYNLQTGVWTTKKLSVPRTCTGAFLNGKVLFAGGHAAGGAVSIVDIYDTATQQWSTAQLTVPRFNMAATTAGTYAVFAGGSTYTTDALDAVDIWNSTTNTWTSAKLSEPRAFMGAATVCGTKAIFAGGGKASWSARFLTTSSNRVDIFDATTGTWSKDSLSQARTGVFAASDGTNFFMGAGWYPEKNQGLSSVEIFTCKPVSGLQHSAQPLIWNVFPNLAQDVLHLQLPDHPSPVRAEVLDMTNRVLLSKTVASNSETIDVSQLSPGSYLLRVTLANGQMSVKGWMRVK
jgi:Secretion system C-terminal sorting domain/Galactose oxidase, central domain